MRPRAETWFRGTLLDSPAAALGRRARKENADVPTADDQSASRSSAGPPRELVEDLIAELGRAFDLSTAIGDRTLGEAMEERIRSLRPGDPGEIPEWGLEGDMTQVARLEAGTLDFYYRPHLFPDMDPALRLGHQLQFDLLPRHLPPASPLRVAAVLESYCHLSGDLFGWRMEGDELFLWIADMCGHGVRAGLSAAVLHFLVDAVGPGREPAELVRRINDCILEARNPGDQLPLFASAFWLRFGADGRGIYASSGHPPMFLRRASGRLEELGATGPPAGLLRRQTYEQVELRLQPGDSLCLFTDGLVEAADDDGEEFGLRRLGEVLRRHSGPALAATRAIFRAIRRHKDTHLLDDDLTFMVAEPASDAA